MNKLTIFTSDKMMAHQNAPYHPECPARLEVIMGMLHTDFSDIPLEDAYPADENTLLLAHPQSHIDFILDQTPFDGYAMIDGDTGMNEHTYDSALLSVGTTIQAVRAVMDDETQTAFALSRPPGHHAEYDTAMGFCFFANAFIGARVSGVKTLIIDFDVHHGNGTEDLVKRRVADGDLDIAYASTHESGIFPKTGDKDSQNICNCPLPHSAGSKEFRQVVTDKIIPFANDFKPELIIFSAGFDGHESDDIAGLNLQHNDFAWVVEQIQPICKKIVSILEGGYNLETLPTSIKHHLSALNTSP